MHTRKPFEKPTDRPTNRPPVLVTLFTMEYRFIGGYREGTNLLHVLSEDRLYVLKFERNNSKDFICYQTILSSPKKTNKNEIKCSARVRIHPDGSLERMHALHTRHSNHNAIIQELEQRNSMKKNRQTLRDGLSEDAHEISTRSIFQREIAK